MILQWSSDSGNNVNYVCPLSHTAAELGLEMERLDCSEAPEEPWAGRGRMSRRFLTFQEVETALLGMD